jgi:hypothetical protein
MAGTLLGTPGYAPAVMLHVLPSRVLAPRAAAAAAPLTVDCYCELRHSGLVCCHALHLTWPFCQTACWEFHFQRDARPCSMLPIVSCCLKLSLLAFAGKFGHSHPGTGGMQPPMHVHAHKPYQHRWYCLLNVCWKPH